jgi:hypothetical protein
MEATVVIPTHDHADTLLYSVASARAQTVADIEIFVVGDGVPDRTRELMAELARSDPRIRFFDSPKGPRHGELHRAAALEQARGRCVCYLCDDDLWLPSHLEVLCGALREADFAHTIELVAPPDGELPRANGFDLGHPPDRRLLLEDNAGVGLSCAGHTLSAYRRLPHGWRTTPEPIHTDIYMWRQFLAEPWCRAVSVAVPTVLKFVAPLRKGWSLERRVAELSQWSERVAAPGYAGRLAGDLLRAVWRRGADAGCASPWIAWPPGEPFPPYTLGDRIDLAAGGNGARYLSWGWSEGEDWGRWSDGAEARLTLGLEAAPSGDLEAEIEARGYLAPNARWLDVDVAVNGERVSAWAFVHRTGLHRQLVRLPARLVRSGLVDLRFHVQASGQAPGPAAPGDPRRLGVGVSWMRLAEATN